MVRAILAGTKTETRRTRGLGRINENPDAWTFFLDYYVNSGELEFSLRHEDGDFYEIKSPYGRAGDELWCREAISTDPSEADITYCADGHVERFLDRSADEFFYKHKKPKKFPSICMPHWASRITQEITDITAQRLHDMTEADAVSEGVGSLAEYKELWDSINGKKYPWAMNPWVWRIQTRRLP
jgi:hypothetical protein